MIIHPINYINTKQYTTPYNNQNNINFVGLNSNIRKLSPLNTYMNKVFDRFTYISKNRWVPVDKEIKPFLKKGNIQVGKEKMQFWEINPDNSKKYIIFYHGIGQNISTNQQMYKSIINKGYGVIAPEYVSFDKTELSEKAIKAKTQSAIDYLNQQGIQNKDIGVVGFSMGSFPAVETAYRNKDIKFLILISPFNSLKNEIAMLTQGIALKLPKVIKYSIKKFPFILSHLDNIFKTKKKLQKINTPLYIIHSENDKVVPKKSSEELSKKVKNLKEFIVVEKGGHNIEQNKIDAFNSLSDI